MDAEGLKRPAMETVEEHPQWPLLSQLPMRFTVAIPLLRFSVKDLLALKAGQTITSTWAVSEDVPVRAGKVQVGWSEFEVVDQRMAVRLTRLA